MDTSWECRRFDGQLAVPRGCARASAHDPECDEQTGEMEIPQDDDPLDQDERPDDEDDDVLPEVLHKPGTRPPLPHCDSKPGT
jgi:hypothetical protein